MSKNKNIIIAAILIVIGIIGVLLCTIPSTSKEQKVINKYINAINDCDMEGIKKCLPLEELGNLISTDYENLFSLNSTESNSKLDFMKKSGLSACSRIPDDAKEVKSISLISTLKDVSTEENVELLSAKEFTVYATIEVSYITSDDETAFFTSKETFQLTETSKGCKIISA